MHPDLLLQLDNVSAGYPRNVLLRGISFAIQRGSFTGLLGANGSGKTTLLKTILGIIPPVVGRLTWTGQPRLGYVPQRDALDPIFLVSSLEVVFMATKNQKDWAMQCLESTGCAELARKHFSELSGGQKQRVLIARALATRPDFLVLDEPTAGIDPSAAAAVMELLLKIHRTRVTILMVSHDLAVVRRHAERVVWLHNGQITEGPAADMLTRERILEIFELDLG